MVLIGVTMKKKFVLSALLIASLNLIGCDCCNRTQTSANASDDVSLVPKVELTGHKSQKFEANQFVSNFSIELRDADKDGVYNKLTERRTKIFDVVKSLDISESSIEQNSVSLTKEWSYDKGSRNLVGYVATQNFVVKLDSRKDAALLSQLLSAEPDIEIYPTQATLKDQDSLQGIIIEAAVKDGMNKASHYAAGAGRTLGKVLYIGSEGDGVFAMGGARRKGVMLAAMNSVDVLAADVSSIADSVEISANVRLWVELK